MDQILYRENRHFEKKRSLKRVVDNALTLLGLCSLFIAGALGLIAWYPWGN